MPFVKKRKFGIVKKGSYSEIMIEYRKSFFSPKIENGNFILVKGEIIEILAHLSFDNKFFVKRGCLGTKRKSIQFGDKIYLTKLKRNK